MNLQDRARHLLARRRQQTQNRRASLLGRSEEALIRRDRDGSGLQ
jgi:hypothetical protein